MFKVIGTETYLNEIKKWPKSDKEAAEEIPKKLAENPFIGAQLKYPFLREKRIREKRIYYLIYEDLKLVLLVAVSGKKDQHKEIPVSYFFHTKCGKISTEKLNLSFQSISAKQTIFYGILSNPANKVSL